MMHDSKDVAVDIVDILCCFFQLFWRAVYKLFVLVIASRHLVLMIAFCFEVVHFHEAAGNQVRAQCFLRIFQAVLLEEVLAFFIKLFQFFQHHRERNGFLEHAAVNLIECLCNGFRVRAGKNLHSRTGAAVLRDTSIDISGFFWRKLPPDDTFYFVFCGLDAVLIINPVYREIVYGFLDLLADGRLFIVANGAANLRAEWLFLVRVHHLTHFFDAGGKVFIFADFLCPEVVVLRKVCFRLVAVHHVFFHEFRRTLGRYFVKAVMMQEAVRILVV